MIRRADATRLLNNFSTGLLTKIKELNGMDIKATPDCMDVYADLDGSLHKRAGRTKLNSVQTGAGSRDCHGLFDFEGTLIGSFGTTYYKMEEMDGTWDSLQTSMSDDTVEMEDYQGNLFICNWAGDYIKTMQVNGTSMTNLNTTNVGGQGAHPKVYKDHLLVSGVPGYPYTFYYSEVSDIDDFANGGTWPINTHDGDELTGWGELEGRNYAFKRWSIHQTTYRGGSPYWSVQQMVRGKGTRSPLTIKNVTLKTGEEVLMFLGSDRKLYQFDGYNCNAVSSGFEENNEICPIALDTLNQGGLKYAHAVIDSENHWYILFVPNGGTSTITHALAYNYYTGAVWPFSGQTLKSSVSAIDANGKRWTIAGDYNGYAHRWNYGTSDDGTTISSYHTTPRMFIDHPATLKEEFEVLVSLKAISDDTVNFQYRLDYNDTWSTATVVPLGNPSGEYYLGTTRRGLVLGTGTLGPAKTIIETPIGLDTQSNYIQFKISDSLTTEPWTLYAYELKGDRVALVKGDS